MTNQSFQSWMAGLDRLAAAQWSQLQQAVQQRSEGAAAVAAIELQIDAERRCLHCQADGAVPRGTTHGLRQYSCKRCGRLRCYHLSGRIEDLWAYRSEAI